MKFACGHCGAKYQISDEKVRGKVLTVRCKRCQGKVRVREGLPEGPGGIVTAPVIESPPAAQPSAASVAAERTVTAPSPRAAAAPVDDGFHDEATRLGGPSAAPAPTPAEPPEVDWYVALDGVQSGPFFLAQLKAKWAAGELGPRHYVWNEHFSNWKLAASVEALRTPPVARSPTVPPARAPEAAEVPEAATVGHPGAISAGAAASVPAQDRVAGQVPSEPSSKGAAAPAAAVPAGNANLLGNVALPAAGENAEAAEVNRMLEGSPFERSPLTFAGIPHASEADLVQRENTRFFVNQAGVNASMSRKRLAAILAAGMALALVLVAVAGATGVIAVEIPGIGDPFAGLSQKLALWDGEAEDAEALKKSLEAKRRAPRRRRRAGRSATSPTTDYVADADDGASGSRGTSAGGTVDIDIGGGGLFAKDEAVPAGVLPESGVEDVALPDQQHLTPKAVEKVVRDGTEALRTCHRRSRRAKERVGGKLVLELTVRANGRVKAIRPRTRGFRGTVLYRCVEERVRTWVFPAFSGPPERAEVSLVFAES